MVVIVCCIGTKTAVKLHVGDAMKQLIFLVPLLCGGCLGEQSMAIFSVRAPASATEVGVVNHSAQHEANLQRALDYSIQKQEAEDMREWKAVGDQRAPVAVAGATEPCAVLNLDTETCDSQ
jgi:hypothetical protein